MSDNSKNISNVVSVVPNEFNVPIIFSNNKGIYIKMLTKAET